MFINISQKLDERTLYCAKRLPIAPESVPHWALPAQEMHSRLP